ncbi:MAG: Phosphopantetheine-binding protein [Parcubacteria group bacterium GW2011_GWF2_45_11]|nr:MAG: Phosphopantetheine-binding protein [Parcubacteria group bacterium GW2011_GWF2_45_11]OGW69895.1 MAG: hypothetical protein A2036_02890 [Omnitrophica bacterium GWA2_50_21]
MREDIIDDILKHIKSVVIPGSNVKPNDMLFESGVLDSFSMVELISFLENKYSIRLTEEDLIKENLETILKIAHLVEKKKK